jgi:SAM-dependent methyltransferase
MAAKRLILLITAIFLASCSQERPARQFQPSVGQEGKDVVWVPTPEGLVEKMLDMAGLTPEDYLIDLGSGDGRMVIAAARRGARALGIEYHPDMVELSKANARKAGVAEKVSFTRGDLFEADLSRATVITLYLMTDLNLRLRPKLLALKPGTRIVSHAFRMDDWEPDQSTIDNDRIAYLWIVPAKAAGTWTWPSGEGGAQLTLSQTYQKIQGVLRLGGRELAVFDAGLAGDRLTFAAGEGKSGVVRYSGRIRGDVLEGNAALPEGAETPWRARRE